MAEINKIDINTLSLDTSISSNIGHSAQTQKTCLEKFWLFSEKRNNADVPYESRYNLYQFYDKGIDILYEDGKKVTIGEEISSYTRILLKENYDEITSVYKTIDDVIEYDEINQMLFDLNTERMTSAELTAYIYNWINKYVNLDYNTNPENADETNLILTHKIDVNFVKDATLSILEKVYRNLMQIIRVKHDFRLYGSGTTIFGGKCTGTFGDSGKMQKWSAIPEKCWKEKTECYAIGSKAYGENIDVGDTIPYTTTYISPYTSYGFLSHTHSVSYSPLSLPTTVYVGRHTAGSGAYPSTTKLKKVSTGNGWKTGNCLGVVQSGGNEDVSFTMALKTNWSWSGTGTSYPKNYTESANWLSKDEVKLPSYLSYVWQWSGKDTTTVYNPYAYINTGS
jgi:hypothetical protein